MNPLAFSKIHYQSVKGRLLQDYPDLDEQTLADTIEGLTALPDIVEAIIRSVLADEAMVTGLKSRIEEMQGRLQRLADRASSRRCVARDVMVETDLRKIMAPDFTASIRAGSVSLQVVDETKIPKDYWVPVEPRLNRQALLASLKSNEDIAGVTLSEPQPTLTVRTR